MKSNQKAPHYWARTPLLTEEQAAIIKGLRRLKIPVTAVIEAFPQVSRQAVYNITGGVAWKQVAPAKLRIVDAKGRNVLPGCLPVTGRAGEDF